MSYRMIALRLMIGLCALGFGLGFWRVLTMDRINNQYPLYPHTTHHVFYPESQSKSGHNIPARLEFKSADSVDTITTWYYMTLMEEDWILHTNESHRLIFLKPLSHTYQRAVITIQIKEGVHERIGTVWYRVDDDPCRPPILC